MSIPNYFADVEAARVKYPAAWAQAHTGSPQTEDFIKLLARDLHAAKDVKVALNGKRGNPHDLSDDALNILCTAADSAGRTPEGLPCVVVDVIGGAGGPNPVPAWGVFTTYIEGSGAHVPPGASLPVPPATQPPGREEALDEQKFLHAYYMAPEGLQRPKGLWRDDTVPPGPDFEGIAAWYLDIYQRERMAMRSRAEARAAYVNQIRQSAEWRSKHPGETP
jgi:hypothetical protein